MNDSMAVINKSAFLNKSVESMIQYVLVIQLLPPTGVTVKYTASGSEKYINTQTEKLYFTNI